MLDSIITFLNSLDKKRSDQLLIAIIGGVCLFVGAIQYFIYSYSSKTIDEIKKAEGISKKAVVLVAEHEKMQQDAKRVQDLFSQNKDFSIKVFFENFYNEQAIMPEPNWSWRIEETNEKFDEVAISAQFKNQTTESMVKFLDALAKNVIVYCKELRIKNESNKNILFELTIATKIFKKSTD